MADSTRYEISAYDDQGQRLSLNPDPEAPERIYADTIWEAVGSLAAVPAQAWMHWDDGETEAITVSRVVLQHLEVTQRRRGGPVYSTNTLEVINR